ncbi:hypothetical protein [Streptomyces sp. NPDC058394]|uniref:hypothetical protein n=1 Tax=unclassified Streptomyces TaxID=2593676 RepID=UPI00365DEFB9
MKRILKRASVVLPLCGILSLGLIGPASAASSGVSRTGVTANVSFAWSGTNSLTGVSYSIRDTECDNAPVYAQLYIMKADGSSAYTTRRFNSKGCNTTQTYSGLSYTSDNSKILYVQLLACVEGTPDWCAASTQLDNPNW